ncbi:MAG: translation initiation factor IF-2 [Elusimicrobia bacterium GWA2_61_42]|nr:MAG: translation initiation factor IF-2 [Elusimicrobia bacterium GWA2_61_42]OGR74167.1 MAG: translation initiation factor IF-2 [Elusimicrobia bacterium GWC2_61_25]
MSPKKQKENENLEAETKAAADEVKPAPKKKAEAKPAGEKKTPAKKAAPKAKKAEGDPPVEEKSAKAPAKAKKAKAEAPAPEPELPKKPDLKRFMFSHSTTEGTIAAGPSGQKEEPKPAEPPKPAAPPPAAAAPAAPAKPAALPPAPAVKPGLTPPVRPSATPHFLIRPPVVPPARPAAPGPRLVIPPLIRPTGPAQRPGPAAPKPPAPSLRPAYPAPARPQFNTGKPQAPKAPTPAAKPAGPAQPPLAEGEKPAMPKLKVSTNVIVRELAEKMGVKTTDFIKKLMGMGVFATINQRLDEDAAMLIAADYGYDLELIPMYGEEELKEEIEHEKSEDLKPRYPIITIMGHVDHGKTTLLDALRESDVVGSEAGQITQHIGAYMVKTPRGNITVLDTPGHEAFTAMRAHGVKITDIVVLVVSAVDGVMPQTLEAINHAKAADAPIIVAINKIDLPTANAQQIKQQLSNHGLLPEDWGGKTPMVEISAKKRLNLDKLLEIVSIQAELMELKANPDKPGQGIVIESRLDSKKGIVATIINVTGTIRIGDPFTVGAAHGKVRALVDDRGNRLEELKPSMPAEVLGISGEVPTAGDVMKVAENEKEARHVADKRKLNRREEALSHQRHVSLLSLKSQVDQKLLRNLNVVLKADVFGSMQAIKDSLERMSTHEVAIQMLHTGIGNITESDVLLAKASSAVILGFHVEADSKVREAAKDADVEIRDYKIIYDLLEDVRAAMSGLLAPEVIETVAGRAEIQQIFDLSSGKVAGSLVREGKLVRNQVMRVLRGKDIVGAGKISGLKRFKEDVKEVEKGLECGILLEGFKDFRVGDFVEVITKEERIRRLAAPGA